MVYYPGFPALFPADLSGPLASGIEFLVQHVLLYDCIIGYHYSGHNRVFEWITDLFPITTRGPITVSFSILHSSPITVSLSIMLPLMVVFTDDNPVINGGGEDLWSGPDNAVLPDTRVRTDEDIVPESCPGPNRCRPDDMAVFPIEKESPMRPGRGSAVLKSRYPR